MQRKDSGYIEDGVAKQEEEEKPQRRVKDMLKEDIAGIDISMDFVLFLFFFGFLGEGRGGGWDQYVE